MSKRIALVAFAATCLLLPLSGSAQATNTLGCRGTTTRGEPTRNTHVVNYRILCYEPITGFGIATNRELEGFEPETLVLDSQTHGPANGESFGCEGPIPSRGFACVGKAGYPRLILGSFNTASPVCSAKQPKLRSVVYATDSNGRLAGAFDLQSPTCPKAHKKKRRSKR